MNVWVLGRNFTTNTEHVLTAVCSLLPVGCAESEKVLRAKAGSGLPYTAVLAVALQALQFLSPLLPDPGTSQRLNP